MSATGERLAPMTPDRLGEAERRLYDAVLDGPRGQAATRRFILRDDQTLTGPFDAWLRSPVLGGHPERAGESLVGGTDGLLLWRSLIESGVATVAG